jgi:hypothetical protein
MERREEAKRSSMMMMMMMITVMTVKMTDFIMFSVYGDSHFLCIGA